MNSFGSVVGKVGTLAMALGVLYAGATTAECVRFQACRVYITELGTSSDQIGRALPIWFGPVAITSAGPAASGVAEMPAVA